MPVFANWPITDGQEANLKTEAVAEILDGRKVLGKTVKNPDDLTHLIRRGLPTGSIVAMAEKLHIGNSVLSRKLGIPQRTLTRRRSQALLLTRAESDRTVRMARVYASAVEMIGDEEEAIEWLSTPNRALGGERPLDQLDETGKKTPGFTASPVSSTSALPKSTKPTKPSARTSSPVSPPPKASSASSPSPSPRTTGVSIAPAPWRTTSSPCPPLPSSCPNAAAETPEVHLALADARAFVFDSDHSQLLTTYERRIHANMSKSLKQLTDLKTARLALAAREKAAAKAEREQALEQARLLSQLAHMESEPCDIATEYPHLIGFVFSEAEIAQAIYFAGRLKQAKHAESTNWNRYIGRAA